MKLFLATIPASILLGAINNIHKIPVLPGYYISPFHIALPVYVTCCAIHHLVSEKVIKPEQQGLENARILFEHSISKN
jgi:hypothetical protein